MSGATSRRKGHGFEVDCANHLSQATGLEVVTARSVSAGLQAGSDLVTITHRSPSGHVDWTPDVHGWSLECKYETEKIFTGHASRTIPKMRPTPWLRQAKKDADSGLYAVIAKVHRHPISEARVFLPRSAFVWWWAAQSTDVHEPLSVCMETFCTMLELPAWTEAA